MNFIKTKLKNISKPIKAIAENTKQIIKNRMSNDKPEFDLVFLCPRIFWMDFPTPEKGKILAQFLNINFKASYYIWNISEHSYDTVIFKNQVAEYTYVGYPCPPLNIIFLICKNIMEWLAADKENIAIIHCQQTKGRSALVISCLLSIMKIVNHPLEALTYFCNINDSQLLFPSQTTYLKHFANICDNIKTNDKVLLLEKIILSEVPLLRQEDQIDPNDQGIDGFKPYIQIFKNSKIIYNYLADNKPITYYTSDLTICFNVNIEVTEDILIRCRHFKTNEERISVFRILLNPAFIFDDVFRIYGKDMDISPNIQVSNEFFIDLIFKKTEKHNEEVDNLLKLKNECLVLVKPALLHKEKVPDKLEMDNSTNNNNTSQSTNTNNLTTTDDDSLSHEGNDSDRIGDIKSERSTDSASVIDDQMEKALKIEDHKGDNQNLGGKENEKSNEEHKGNDESISGQSPKVIDKNEANEGLKGNKAIENKDKDKDQEEADDYISRLENSS